MRKIEVRQSEYYLPGAYGTDWVDVVVTNEKLGTVQSITMTVEELDRLRTMAFEYFKAQAQNGQGA